MGVCVRLTWYELFLASSIGLKRHIEALQQNRHDRHGFKGDGWGIHIEGAAGEMAAAKTLNRYYSGSVNTFQDGGDVGSLQVRTRSEASYDLIVRDGDKDEDIFVLVVGVAPEFEVIGWIKGCDAKRPEWRQTHGRRPAAYFVPQSALRPMEELQ